jgi:protein-S-isoprenylcysteine O-methyltransferase Ste14
MRVHLLAYGLVVLFLATERLLRQGDDARTLQTTASDHGTTRLIGAAYGYALSAGLLAPLLSRRGWGRMRGDGWPVLALETMAVGLALKVWAMRALGRYYTRTLRTAEAQPVVDSGPYRFVRHPGYLGALLLWLGFGLAVRNWLAGLAIWSAMLAAYVRRMGSEEAMLLDALGDAYAAYRRRTWRLVPGLY